jgi:hypothetical protein
MNQQFDFFACVVDGEFAGAVGVARHMEPLVAGMNSNPTIIPIKEEQLNILKLGMIWDGKEFQLAKE